MSKISQIIAKIFQFVTLLLDESFQRGLSCMKLCLQENGRNHWNNNARLQEADLAARAGAKACTRFAARVVLDFDKAWQPTGSPLLFTGMDNRMRRAAPSNLICRCPARTGDAQTPRPKLAVALWTRLQTRLVLGLTPSSGCLRAGRGSVKGVKRLPQQGRHRAGSQIRAGKPNS